MQEKKYTWHKVAESEEAISFGPNGMAEMEVADKRICVVVHNEQLHACTAKCPHAGGSLAQGYVDAVGNLVCPLHRYRFSLQNGRNTSGEGYYLKRFPVEKRADGIFIGFEENNLFNWLK